LAADPLEAGAARRKAGSGTAVKAGKGSGYGVSGNVTPCPWPWANYVRLDSKTQRWVGEQQPAFWLGGGEA